MTTATGITSENKAELIRQALEIAYGRIAILSQWRLNVFEKNKCKIRLRAASEVLARPNSGGDIETRWLWPHSRVGPEANVEAFFKQPRFATLGAIVEVDFGKIESALRGLDLKVTVDLQTFYEVYHELLAEETRPAK